MTVAEIESRASAHEVTVGWPTYLATKARMEQREEARGIPAGR